MAVKFPIPSQSTLYTYLSLFIIFFCSINMSAQCAGIAGSDNNTLNVCDIADKLSKSIDLNLLLGAPTAGGTWSDDDKSRGLNATTGILNAQLITKSGIYKYTYTVSDGLGCIDTALITVTIGGYAGIPGEDRVACNNENINLFQIFDGSKAAPQINGTWVDNDNSGGLDSNFLDTSIPIPRDDYPYTYTYTVPSPIGSTCPTPKPSTVKVTIYKNPIPGTSTDVTKCSDEVSSFTNLDLNGQLTGADAGGVWSDETGTSEISNDTDSFINVQNIYNTKGAGTYKFRYTLTAAKPTVCQEQYAFVNITIEEQLDLTGATLTVGSNICEDQMQGATYSAILHEGTKSIADGSYEITYKITNHVTGAVVTQQTISNFSNIKRAFTFIIPASNFQMAADYTVEIVDLIIASGVACKKNIMGTTANTILSIYPLPKINNATLKIDSVCQTEDATVYISGTSNLTNDDYDISYILTAPNLTTVIHHAVLSITGGLRSFKIPKNLIPNVGLTKITITNIQNSTTGCTNTSTLNKEFTINPLPDVSNLAITIKDVCQGQPATIDMTGLGTLTDISIDYTISGVNTVPSQTKSLTVVGGIKSFSIPATDIPKVGSTTFTIVNITNSLTGCSRASGNQTTFEVNPIPAIPIANDQKFCSSNNPTVVNLNPQGNQYKWFDSATSTVPLISTTPLITGNYYVKEVNVITGCESSLKMIGVQNNATPQINSTTLTIDPVCQGYPVNVKFLGSSNLADGNYDIRYNLRDNNIATAVPITLNITSGFASFSIAPNLIPKAGNTTIEIASITNLLTNCSNTSTQPKVFVVNPLPDVTNMVVTVKDGCLGQPLNVQLSELGTLSNITLSYTVSGANGIGSQTIPLVVSAGNTSFQVPASSLLKTGNNTLIITDLTNTANSCSTIINSVSKNFEINSIPSSPTAGNQEFCETNLATVANLIPNGNQYKWYTTATNTTPLASNALLISTNYFLKEGNATTGCESNATPISVLINTVAAPILSPSGQDFCGVDKPTIQNLSNNVTASGNLAWYDVATNGTLLNSTNLLKEGFTYYGIDSSTITNCRSYALEVTVSLTDCTATPENFFIPDGFSPNGDGVNETFQIIDIEFLFPNYTLEIFNRYGNILFKGDINKPAWDGKNSNTNFINGDTPTGVYFYVIHYNKDNLPPKQGQLYLNR